jgi:Fe-S oxidoreductase
LVTVSPHCYDVFRNRYPHADNLSPQHYTQLLSDLVKAERIQFKRALPWKVTYQDPCFLGRWNQEYEAPRRVLAEIPELSLVEMEHHGPEALCCGGGGGRMWMETPLGERFSDLRIQEAMGSEAEVIATSCPFCVSCLEDSLKAQNVEGMKVMDVAEIALLSLAEES